MDKERRHFIKNKLQVIQTGLEILLDKLNSDIESIELINALMHNIEEINKTVDRNIAKDSID